MLAQDAPAQAGTVSGLQATTVRLGNSIGVAVIGVVFFGALSGGFPHAFTISLVWLAALPLAAAVAIQFVPGPDRPGRRPGRPGRPGEPGRGPEGIRGRRQP